MSEESIECHLQSSSRTNDWVLIGVTNISLPMAEIHGAVQKSEPGQPSWNDKGTAMPKWLILPATNKAEAKLTSFGSQNYCASSVGGESS